MTFILVTIDYEDVMKDPSSDSTVVDKLVEVFGSGGLPMVVIRSVPQMKELVPKVLQGTYKVAHLPTDYIKSNLTDDASGNNAGWSLAKTMAGKTTSDSKKGSFYYNALNDSPGNEATASKYPSFSPPNKWPCEKVLADFKEPAKDLGTIMHNTLVQFAKHVDAYVLKKLGSDSVKVTKLYENLEKAQKNKCKLLYYFPQEPSEYWSGWHLDTGFLTGLAGGMFMDDDTGEGCGNVDEKAGLYIARDTSPVTEEKIEIPEGSMGVQFGDMLHVMTGGHVKATPHCVRPSNVAGQARAAMVCFTDIGPDVKIQPPEGISRGEVLEREIKHPMLSPPLEKIWMEDSSYGDIHMSYELLR